MPSLQFKGKAFVQHHHLVVPFHELTPVKAKGTSKTASLHDNVIVHGDNLRALKALLPTHAGKVKCIYIDPPYNTGNEGWAYNDNVSSPMLQEWLGKTVDRDDLTRHDKWCCMMLPRLRLLREFLTDDGAIFVSIDDNEVHRLRCLMDEIFGEENFVESFIWKKSYGGGAKERYAVRQHEYCLMFARDKENLDELWLPPDPDAVERYYKFEDAKKVSRGPYRIKPLEATKSMDARENLVYPIMAPDGTKVMPKRQWWWSKARVEKAIKNDELVFTKTAAGYSISYKQYLVHENGDERRKKPFTVVDGIYTQAGSEEQNEIFGKQVLAYPKPSEFVKKMIYTLVGDDKDSLVMDSFAGSGTTAHAVLALNKQDGGNRRFVLVEGEDYADTITAERVRRVIKGVPSAKDETLRAGLGGSFSYFKLGQPLSLHSILEGKDLPAWQTLASYLFFTATGEEFDPKQAKRKEHFIGTSRLYDVFLLYTEDPEKLKDLALTLDVANALRGPGGKQKLVFAPTKYLDEHFLDRLRITFQQLPFQIYQALDV